MSPSSYQIKGRFKKDLCRYTDAPDQFIQAFISGIQTYKLKDVMFLVDQTLTSLEKQQVLAQATQMGDNFHLQWAPMPPAPGNEEIEMPKIPTGGQEVLQADPPLGPK
jgi:hypothetical protein